MKTLLILGVAMLAGCRVNLPANASAIQQLEAKAIENPSIVFRLGTYRNLGPRCSATAVATHDTTTVEISFTERTCEQAARLVLERLGKP